MSKQIFNMHSVVFLAALFLSVQFPTLKADLPVHCLKHQIVGSWNLFLTSSLTKDPSEKLSCGHTSPDHQSTSYLAMIDEFESSITLSLKLGQDDTVKEESSSHSSSLDFWTMIYDEGFEIRHNNVRYFTFSEYVKTEAGYKSRCSSTLVGWYHNYITHEKGCFRAQKADGSSDLTKNAKQAFVVEPEYIQKKGKKEYVQLDQKEKSKENLHIKLNERIEKDQKELHKKEQKQKIEKHIDKKQKYRQDLINFQQIDFNQHQKISERLNKNVNKKWVAAVNPDFGLLNLNQLNVRAGRKKSGNVIPDYQQFMAFVEMDRYQSSYGSDVSDLPKELSWVDSLKPTKSQGNCGSCYIFATLAMLQARLKIKHNEDVTLSVQHSVNCNFYNQGCDGGYPFLVEKYANEYELVEESCLPYYGYNGQCSESCDVSELEKTYYVKDYKFIGGSYGKSNERDMMVEIMNNGPIVASFEPTYDFMYYQSGIYHSVPAASWIMSGEKKPEWEKVDHSVLCFGWGEEDGEKFWILQNTWGATWGENGFFRIRRGTDESHIESLAEAADPYVRKNAVGSVFKEKKSRLFN